MTLRVASGLELPAEAVTQTFAILARKGAGKTYGAKVLAEEMLKAGFQIVVLDPLGVWYGLRSKFDIAILGGDHADVPLEPTSGAVIADFVVAERLSVILDVSGFSESGMVRFVAEFGERFYRKNRDPVHWFVDEADEFAPQTGFKGDAAKCLGAMQRIVRRGRQRGIGCTLITQRSAVLNKSVLTQTEGLFIMQTTGPQDIKAIRDWIDQNGDVAPAEITREIRKFQTGEAYFYSPAWLKKLVKIKFRKAESFDSSATPKAGTVRKKPRTLVDVDVRALKASMAATIEKAEAADPAKLRLRIRELEKKVKAKQGASDASSVERAVAAAVKERDGHWRCQVATLTTAHKKATSCLGQIHRLSETNGELTVAIKEPPGPRTPHTSVPPPIRRAERSGAQRREVAFATGDTKLKKAEAAILRALFWLKDEEATPAKIGFYSDYTAGGGSYSNALGKLRSMGLVSGNRITPAGEAAIPADVEAKPTGMELREWLRPKLGKATNVILDVLIEAGGKRLSSAEIGDKSEYTEGGGSFSNALGRLRSLQAAEGRERDGGTKAADVFFE